MGKTYYIFHKFTRIVGERIAIHGPTWTKKICNLYLKVFHGLFRGSVKKKLEERSVGKSSKLKKILFNNINPKKLAMTKINR